MRRAVLLLVAFLAGAILMGLELIGSRLLQPYFGNSIFVWGSLIGVFLAAMSLGYYAAGKLVDRWPTTDVLAAILLAAGLFVLLIPRYGNLICDRISLRHFGPRADPLIACMILFFLPGVLMAATSPFVIRLTARTVAQVGGTAGTVYAVSTIGSIVGTLGSAFYLIGWLGTTNNFRLLGGLLVLTAVIAAAVRQPRQAVATAAALLALCMLARPAEAAGERVLLERDSPYHRLVVSEQGDHRWLRADNIWHTQMDLRDRHGRGLPYTDYVDLAFLFNPNIRSVLIIGLGGGTIPKR
jgi:predicted membrane-bound spermidine synthase